MSDHDATDTTRTYLGELQAALDPSGTEGATRQAAEGGLATPALNRLRTLVEDRRTAISETEINPANTALLSPVLQRLTAAAAGYDDDAFERRAADVYQTPAALRADLLIIIAVSVAPEPAIEILTMQQYVHEAAVPDSQTIVALDELIIDRRLALERLTMDVATTAPHQLEELTANFEIFRQRYEHAYGEHHRRYYEALVALQTTIADAEQRLKALAILNDIQQLGPALGTNLQLQATNFLDSLAPCAVDPVALRDSLRTVARCHHCNLQLADQPASAEVERWQRDLDRALATQQRRLASAMVTRAVRETGRQRFDRFLRAVRAGDLTPIVEVVDDELADLIRTLLADDD